VIRDRRDSVGVPLEIKYIKYEDKVIEFKPKRKGRTKSVKGEGKSNRVYPIKEKENIEKMKQYFREQIDNKWYQSEKIIAGRDLCLFKFSLNVGLRMSDIVKLKWGDIFYNDNTFRDAIVIQEKKTGKYKEFYLNDNAKKAITDFINEFNITIKLDEYIFPSREGGHIEVRRVNQIIKQAGKAVGIKYRLGTHSCRKTWAYWQIMNHQNDAYFLAHLMNLLNHSDIASTLHYAGISSEQTKQYYDDVNL